MSISTVWTPNAPSWPDLPYSQATVFENTIYVSGQIAVDVSTGAPVEGGIGPQTETVLRYIESILLAAGSSCDHVLKTLCFLTDRRRDYEGFNLEYRKYFPQGRPARAVVEVSELAPGYVVEIEVVAAVPGGIRPGAAS